MVEIQDQIGIDVAVPDSGLGDESQSVVLMHIFTLDTGRSGCPQIPEIRILIQSELISNPEPVRDIVLNVEVPNISVHIVRVFIGFRTVNWVISNSTFVTIALHRTIRELIILHIYG